MTAPRLYHELAAIWPLFSPAEHYEEEVQTFRARLHRHNIPDGACILHLGSGGGSIDYNLKQHYRVTGVDVSADMIAQARRINPELEYLQGDIRDIRLNQTFDAVLLHDAISYMTSIEELEQAYRTAAAHLKVGGLMITLPEELRERLAKPDTSAETFRRGDTVLSVMETSFDENPDDHVFEQVYVFVIREGGELRVEIDRHTNGVFELSEFVSAIERAGFEAQVEKWELSDWDGDPELPLITALKKR